MYYTEGEWHIIKDTDNRLHIMSRGKDTTMSINVARMPVSPDAEANAHLIAAAPDMYEALRAMLKGSEIAPRETDVPIRVWERSTPSEDAILTAFAALAKADGGN